MSANSKNATTTMGRRDFVAAGTGLAMMPHLGRAVAAAQNAQEDTSVGSWPTRARAYGNTDPGAAQNPMQIERRQVGPTLARDRKIIAGSLIGGIAETQAVIDFCAACNIKADVEVIGVRDINKAFDRVVKKDVRYRFVIDMASLGPRT